MSDRNKILRRVRAAGGPDRQLLARCRGLVAQATEADRGLDTILADALGIVPDGYWRSPDLGVRYEADWRAGIRGPDWSPPPLTGSVDAALALAGQVLPKWSINLGLSEGYRHPCAIMGRSYPTNARVAVEHHTTPLVILAAVLAALAEETSHAR